MKAGFFTKIVLCSTFIAVVGCSSKVPDKEKYSGFLSDYSKLKKTESSTGKPVLRWVDPNFNPDNYDSIVYNSLIYYPTPKPSTQVGEDMLNQLLTYTDNSLKNALAKRKPLVKTPGHRSLIFRGAITGVSSTNEGLQFYEVLPVTLLVAATQMATGHRTMETHLFVEEELIDASTHKPVLQVVRLGEGKDIRNQSTPMNLANLKPVIDNLGTDVTAFNIKK
ncbi:DUF3313 domain-containing protein [Shimwellia blattae]|uniref:Putative lipoprotein n=1 Tax=Shimwellia blattae (strain ATCC 29907 / DSM 4481 / JCM 1650 / NBRC 105725 / CDC 9005-74) TaxID=630626 RepID=I2BEB5_SHIBC|nr:DUF3313 domain-containing protein [Shimwellia blattae]AFJ48869.1 putative lipoprotein [Shimwellia blattae DSM 4481 = NBRC 105725]GAB81858.1 hypothetical protein YdcL [Shimwellia blattae DSM 4481 = NBRC 105725]VDY66353.1 Protein of uncharacterised function (DUF3313) [Shimwellia blattae]VEC27920.1 Protein of uncharacterised function (DUF3313) [Shimwellia blattae]